ncbi:MAG: GTPase HflX [Clostridia bacterium]
MEDNIIKKQRVLLVFINNQSQYDIDELTELVKTADGEVVLTVNQNKEYLDKATVVGSGKLLEIASQVEANDIDLVVFEETLSPIQLRNIQEKIPCLVIDRTNLILDIFAMHASSAQGKIQVELAQLKYNLPRLRSELGELTRQGGGIGTRGPGETKLEVNKRKIKDRITFLNEKLREITKQRGVSRNNRMQNNVPIVALTGYTNAGKSTLFNFLTQANVLAENKLFATLDTTARKMSLNGVNVIFTDTVGFINNLPHGLIESFKSTLEEITYADLILDIVDISSSQHTLHQKVTEELLAELGITSRIITVYNKCDLLMERFENTNDCVYISALKNIGVEELLKKIEEHINQKYIDIVLTVPCDKLDILGLIQKFGTKTTMDYTEENVIIKTTIERIYLSKFEQYIK